MRKFSLAITSFILLAAMGSAQASYVEENEYSSDYQQDNHQYQTSGTEDEHGDEMGGSAHDNTNPNAMEHAGSTGMYHANQNSSITNDMAPVPVPAAAWLLASGLIGMVGVARRRAH